jgi:CTP:phosphocholine cytidylyltransferase-like protein
MKRKKLKELKFLAKHLHYYNGLAPFPVYDTEYVDDVDNLIKEMDENKKVDYDKEPVVACKYCKSLHIVSDELENNICFKCGAVNELEEFENINGYLKFKNGKS